MSSANSELNASLSSNSSKSGNDITGISDNGGFGGIEQGRNNPLLDLPGSGKDGLVSETGEETLQAEENKDDSAGTGLLPIAIGGTLAAAFVFASVAVLLHKKSRRRKKREDMDYESTYEPYRFDGTESSVKVLLDEADVPFRIGRIHDVGRRSMQQDSFGISDTDDLEKLQEKCVLSVVAD